MSIDFEKMEEREPEFAKLHAKGNGVGAIMNMDTSFHLTEADGATEHEVGGRRASARPGRARWGSACCSRSSTSRCRKCSTRSTSRCRRQPAPDRRKSRRPRQKIALMAQPFRIGVMQLTMEPLEEMLESARVMDRAGMDTIWLAEAYPWWRKHGMEARSSTVVSALIANARPSG